MTAFTNDGQTVRPQARRRYTGWWHKCPRCGYYEESDVELAPSVLHRSDSVSCEWCGQEYTVEYNQRDYA